MVKLFQGRGRTIIIISFGGRRGAISIISIVEKSYIKFLFNIIGIGSIPLMQNNGSIFYFYFILFGGGIVLLVQRYRSESEDGGLLQR